MNTPVLTNTTLPRRAESTLACSYSAGSQANGEGFLNQEKGRAIDQAESEALSKFREERRILMEEAYDRGRPIKEDDLMETCPECGDEQKIADEKRMVRTLNGTVRAFLSDRYRPIDNYDIAEAVLPVLQERKLNIRSCEITEKHLWIKVTSKEVQGEVKKGEPICAGFAIRNSEVGCGAFAIESFVEFLICTNGMRGNDLLRKYHTGTRAGTQGEGAWEFLRDETRMLTDKALFAQVGDLTRAALSFEYFDGMLTNLRRAAGEKITEDPAKVVEVVCKHLQMNETERGSVLRHLIEGADLSRFGLSAAITRTAQDADEYDRASEIEALGFDVIELPKQKWEAMAVV